MNTSVRRMRLSTRRNQGDHPLGRSSARDRSPRTGLHHRRAARRTLRRCCALVPGQPSPAREPRAARRCRRRRRQGRAGPGRAAPAPTWRWEHGPGRRALPASAAGPAEPPAAAGPPAAVPAPPLPLSASPRHHVWRGRTGPGAAAPPRSARGCRGTHSPALPLPPLLRSRLRPPTALRPGAPLLGIGGGAERAVGRCWPALPPPRPGQPGRGAEGEPGLPAGAGPAARGTGRAWRQRGRGGQAGSGPGEPDSPRPLPEQEQRPALPGRAALETPRRGLASRRP